MNRSGAAVVMALLLWCLGLAAALAQTERAAGAVPPLLDVPQGPVLSPGQDTPVHGLTEPQFRIGEDTPAGAPSVGRFELPADTSPDAPGAGFRSVGEATPVSRAAWPPDSRLLNARWGPLSDRGRGRLYGAVAQLLRGASELPETIDLGIRRAPKEPAEREDPPPEQVPQPDAGEQREAEAAPAEPAGWVAVLDAPVVAEEKLAHAYFLARSYPQAAALYRRLREERPDEPHLLLMLLLSERNAGSGDQVEALLEELRAKGAENGEWAAWMKDMMELAEVPKEGE
ncbi:MAG: hypothetical protein ACYS8K_00495 [Planctomycetota bacterium]|jgi:hypothetical protein